jgi:predicted RNA binding protein YcfA (HicA-like mRNA interferase family)
MSRLPVISGAVCIKVLAKIGFVIDRQRGSHVILVREDPALHYLLCSIDSKYSK